MDNLSIQDPARSHRRILANIDTYADSSSDRDFTEDEFEGPSDQHSIHDALVGVSMSDAQTRMKSPSTPAYEKAQALEASRGFFGELDAYENGVADTTEPSTSELHIHRKPVPKHEPEQQPSRSPSGKKRTTSLSKALRNHDDTTGRRRSSSNPVALLRGLRKFRTSTSSPSSASKPSSPTVDAESVLATTDSIADTIGTKSLSLELTDPRSPITLDSNVSSSEDQSPTSPTRPQMLRRVTSDNSLYLKRTATGASKWDDTTVYSTVADMPNSRFKAITDSLQDAAFRIPKFPNLSFSQSRTSLSRTGSDETRRNTEANTNANRNMAMFKEDAINSSVPSSPAVPKTTKHPILKDSLSRAHGDLVLLGGYRGSILRSADPPHQQVWVPVKVGLNLRKVDLEVGLTHEDEERMEEKIVPDGILSHIGPIDIARRFLGKMYRCHNVRHKKLRVHNWGYDWRLSPHRLSGRLVKFLESLPCNQPDVPPEERGALVIAHSLGGLITRHAVNQRPELFSGVVYAGVPQHCVNILGPMRNGDDVLISSRVLTAQVNFTLRTSYALLPESGRCFINRETRERYNVDFFDPETWDEYRLSPCINTPLTPLTTISSRRKTLVGTLSDSISSLADSLPTKRNSWFANGENSPTVEATQAHNPTPQNLKEKAAQIASHTMDSVTDAAKHAIQTASHTRDPPSDDNSSQPKHQQPVAEQSLEPTMKQSSTNQRPSIATTVTLSRPAAKSYLVRTLAEIKQFKHQLAHNPDHQSKNTYPPCAIIFGKTVPTVYGAKVASREAIKYTDAYDDLAFASGDGVVLASAAQLPAGYRCVRGGRVESDRGHVGLLGDLEGLGRCITAVLEGRAKGIGLGNNVRENGGGHGHAER